jgi:hypothetical protein
MGYETSGHMKYVPSDSQIRYIIQTEPQHTQYEV